MITRHLRRFLAGHLLLALTVVVSLAVSSAVLLVALGVADATLWRSLPFPNSDRIRVLRTTVRAPGRAVEHTRWSWPRLRWIGARLQTTAATASVTAASLTLTGTGTPESITGEVVTSSFFTVMGVAPRLGRPFTVMEDSTPGTHPVVIVSDDFARERLGGPRRASGQLVRLNGHTLTVVGVMPPGFRGASDRATVWVPATMAPLLNYPEYLTTPQDFIGLVARLRDDAPVEALHAELDHLMPQLQATLPAEDTTPGVVVSATSIAARDARVPPAARLGAWTLLAAAALLHLLACANSANLLTGHALSRRRERAVRLALGGLPHRVAMLAVAEAVALVIAASLLGIAAAWVVARAFPGLDLIAAVPRRSEFGSFGALAFDARTVVAGLALLAATLPLVTAMPTLTSLPRRLDTALREGVHGSSRGGSRRRPGARSMLVAVEVALTLVLLTGAALLGASYLNIRNTDLGVDADQVLTFELQPSEREVPTQRAPAYIDRVLEAIRAVPGVVAASVDGGAPTVGSASTGLHIIGRPVTGEPPVVHRHYVGPDHLAALGLTLRRGRMIAAADRADQPRVVVISETAARRFWPGRDPIGERVWFTGSTLTSPDSSAAVIGVVSDVRYDAFDREANIASFYTPYAQFTYAWRVYFVRTAGPPMTYEGAIRGAVQRVSADVPMTQVRPLPALVASSWQRQERGALASMALAAAALGLAVLGIGAVVAHSVASRGRDLAIRAAMGASPRRLFREVVADGMAYPVFGALVGVMAALSLGRLLRGLLYGVAPADPLVLGATTVAVLVVAAVACAFPALRASRSDPMGVLRAD